VFSLKFLSCPPRAFYSYLMVQLVVFFMAEKGVGSAGLSAKGPATKSAPTSGPELLDASIFLTKERQEILRFDY
jgi:hypothetical protein